MPSSGRFVGPLPGPPMCCTLCRCQHRWISCSSQITAGISCTTSCQAFQKATSSWTGCTLAKMSHADLRIMCSAPICCAGSLRLTCCPLKWTGTRRTPGASAVCSCLDGRQNCTRGLHHVPAAHLPVSQSFRFVCEGATKLAATSSHTAPACRGKTAVYWAVLSHSVDALDILCAHARSRGLPLNVSLPDNTGNTPLDIAVASQQWRAVKILVQYGGLKDSVRLRDAMASLPVIHQDMLSRRSPAPLRLSDIPSAIVSLFGVWATPKPISTCTSFNSLAGAPSTDHPQSS